MSRSGSAKRARAKSPGSAIRAPKHGGEEKGEGKGSSGAPALSSLRRSTPWTFFGLQLDGLVGLLSPWLLHMTVGQVRVLVSSLLVLLLYTGYWVTLSQQASYYSFTSPFFFGSWVFVCFFSVCLVRCPLCSLHAHARNLYGDPLLFLFFCCC